MGPSASVFVLFAASFSSSKLDFWCSKYTSPIIVPHRRFLRSGAEGLEPSCERFTAAATNPWRTPEQKKSRPRKPGAAASV